MWPDPRVESAVNGNFIPVRLHPQQQPDDFKKYGRQYGAQWTPTILLLDPEGNERHRIEGFLPVEDLVAQLMLGLAHMKFNEQQFSDAAALFENVAQQFPNSEWAPEALYWTGAARYKATNDPKALAETANQFATRYQTSSWAKKASVWKK